MIIIFVWKKYTKTKKLQRQMERVNQWTKKVIVVQPCIDNTNPGISDSLVRVEICKKINLEIFKGSNPKNLV